MSAFAVAQVHTYCQLRHCKARSDSFCYKASSRPHVLLCLYSAKLMIMKTRHKVIIIVMNSRSPKTHYFLSTEEFNLTFTFCVTIVATESHKFLREVHTIVFTVGQ